jgi:competence protein ComEC
LLQISGQNLLVTIPRSINLSLGDHVEVKGVARPWAEGREANFLNRQVAGRLVLDRDSISLVQRGAWPYRLADETRRRFMILTSESMPEPAAQVMDAVCFNVDGLLPPETALAFRKTGTIHIVSASGVHVVILSAALFWLLGHFPLPRPAKITLVFGLLSFYALAAGLNPPIVRAVCMSLVGSMAYLFRREPDLVTAAAAAGLGWLLLKPVDIYDVGFQLSYVTVLALALYLRPLPSPTTLGSAILQDLAMATRLSFVSTLATAPILLATFGAVSLLGLIANPLIALPIMVLLPLGLAGFALSTLGPVGGWLLTTWGSAWAGAVLALVEWISLSPFGYLTDITIEPWLVCLIYIGLAVLHRRRRIAANC